MRLSSDPIVSGSRAIKSNRRRKLLGLWFFAMLLFNYPFLLIAEAILGPPATPFIVFGSWGLIITGVFATTRLPRN